MTAASTRPWITRFPHAHHSLRFSLASLSCSGGWAGGRASTTTRRGIVDFSWRVLRLSRASFSVLLALTECWIGPLDFERNHEATTRIPRRARGRREFREGDADSFSGSKVAL